jgi:hypothetical protein
MHEALFQNQNLLDASIILLTGSDPDLPDGLPDRIIRAPHSSPTDYGAMVPMNSYLSRHRSRHRLRRMPSLDGWTIKAFTRDAD